MNTRWSPFVKQIVIVSGLIATIWLIFREEVLLGPLILTLLLAYLVTFPVNFLVRHTGWPRTLIVILVYLLLLLLIAIAPVVIVPAADQCGGEPG